MDRIITSDELKEDTFEQNIRPDNLEEYVGQSEVKETTGSDHKPVVATIEW